MGDSPADTLSPIPPDRVPAFNRHLGMERIRSGGGRARIDVDVQEELTNRRGVVHGGLLTALLDSVLGAAVISAIRPEEWCGTMQLDVQFLEPGRGPSLVAAGQVVRRGRHVAFAQGDVRNSEGRVVATAQGTWYVWPSRPD